MLRVSIPRLDPCTGRKAPTSGHLALLRAKPGSSKLVERSPPHSLSHPHPMEPLDWRMTPRAAPTTGPSPAGGGGGASERPVPPYQPPVHLRAPSAGGPSSSSYSSQPQPQHQQPSPASEVENWRAGLHQHQRHLTASSDRSFSSYIIPAGSSGDVGLGSPPPFAAGAGPSSPTAPVAPTATSPPSSSSSGQREEAAARAVGRGTVAGGEGERPWARWREEGGAGAGYARTSVRSYSALDGWAAPVSSAAELSSKQPAYPASTTPPPGLAAAGFPKRTYSSLFSEQQQQQEQQEQAQQAQQQQEQVQQQPARPSPAPAAKDTTKRAGIVIKGVPAQARMREVLELFAPFGEVSDGKWGCACPLLLSFGEGFPWGRT